jgi:hypothetical protein
MLWQQDRYSSLRCDFSIKAASGPPQLRQGGRRRADALHLPSGRGHDARASGGVDQRGWSASIVTPLIKKAYTTRIFASTKTRVFALLPVDGFFA